MRRAMTWVYCEPKSRIRIFECFGGAAVFMDAFGGRRVRRRDLPVPVVRGRSGLRRLRRAEVATRLLRRFVVRADLRNRRREACSLSRSRSKGASSAHFRNEADKSNSAGLTGTK